MVLNVRRHSWSNLWKGSAWANCLTSSRKYLWGNKGLRVVMARQEGRKKRVTKKWHEPSILVLNISRRLSDIKQIIRQQFEYLKFKTLSCKATVPFISYCSLMKQKKECSFAKSMYALHFTVRYLCDSGVATKAYIWEGLSLYLFFIWNLWVQSHILWTFCLVGGHCFLQLWIENCLFDSFSNADCHFFIVLNFLFFLFFFCEESKMRKKLFFLTSGGRDACNAYRSLY